MSLVNIMTSESGIVKEGLQVWLDANVNSSLPPSSASPTSWYDLSLNNRYATIYPTSVDETGDFGEGGNIYFNGGAGAAGTLNYSLPVLQSTDSFTWSILIYLPSGNGQYDVIFGNRHDAVGASGIEFTKFTPTNFEYYSSGAAHTPYTIPTNKFHHLCVTKNGTSFVYYDNGEVVNSRTTSKNLTGVNPIYLATGKSDRNTENANVTFYQVLLYDIGLSKEQVQQNFNSVRGRYGI